MTLQDAMLVSDRQVIESIINNKFINDYGTIESISSDKLTCNVRHQVLLVFNGEVIDTPLVSNNVELLYLSTSSLSIDNTPKVGDPVMLIGLRRYIPSTATPMPTPAKPLSNIAYEMSTMKAVPLSAINSASELTIRAKDSKLMVKNSQETLATVLSDFMDKVVSIATTKTLTALDGVTATVASFGSPGPVIGTINSTLTASDQSDINSIKTRLLKLLEP